MSDNAPNKRMQSDKPLAHEYWVQVFYELFHPLKKKKDTQVGDI